MQAAKIYQTGGADVFTLEEVETASPGASQVRIRQTVAGLNFIDVYMRTGMYPVAALPAILGMEAAGTVVEVGEGVSDFSIGDRVAYAMVTGAYTQERVIAADKLVRLPDTIEDETAAALMLKGLTAHYLLFRTYPVQAGESILVYAAAGGVGSLLCQWASHLGARVIGCVGNEEKAEIAKANGCHHTILYKQENIPQQVKRYTDGEGVSVVYDAVGKTTFEDSLDALRPFGMMVSYGNASGKVAPFDPSVLAPKGSLYVTRPTLATHVATRELLLDGADQLFTALAQNIIKPNIQQKWPLAEVAEAHRALESGATAGASVLTLLQ